MKRWTALFLCILLALSLASCGTGEDAERNPGSLFPSASVSGTEAVEPDAAPEEGAFPEDGEPEESVFPETAEPESGEPDSAAPDLPEDGSYTSRDDVAAYLVQYGRLPDNFITKREARNLGWNGGGLEPYAPGMCIGGDRFGNYEGLLPEGHSYRECDIDTLGKDSRGAKRIIFSDDGLIYYTEDHYASFTLLYGEA